MAILIFLIAFSIFLLSLYSLIKPKVLSQWLDIYSIKSLYYFAIISRALIGVIFILGADQTRLPLFLFWFGILVLASSLTLVLIKQARFEKLLIWWKNLSIQTLRLSFVIALIISGIILFSVV